VNPSLLSQHFSATGAGAIAGLNAEIFKNFRVISTNYWSDGGGRYLFGQAPDLIVRSNGSLSLVHAGGTIDGFEARVAPKLLLYAYFGGIYISEKNFFPQFAIEATTYLDLYPEYILPEDQKRAKIHCPLGIHLRNPG